MAALRIAARTSAELGTGLSEMFPNITFDTDLVDEVVVRAGVQEVRASVQQMVQAERLDAQGAQLAQAAVRKARQPGP